MVEITTQILKTSSGQPTCGSYAIARSPTNWHA